MRTVYEYTAKDGAKTYRVRFRLGPKQTTESFYKKADAVTFAKILDATGTTDALAWLSAKQDTHGGHALTFGQWHEHYVDQLTGVTSRTKDDYRALRRRYLADLDPLPLPLVTRAHVSDLVNRLDRDGRSPKTIKNVIHMLSSCMALAIDEGHATRNPCHRVRLPQRRLDAEAMTFLSPAEFEHLLSHVPDHYKPLVLTLGGTGMRWSEATAIMGQHVNGNLLTVRQAWKRIPGGWEMGVPKTAKSRRTITLPQSVADALAPLARRDVLVFRTPQGHPVRHSNFYKRVWRPACAAAGFDPAPGIHALRHSSVAWLIAAGVSLPVIQARLGHEKITTTIDTYGHLLPDLHVAAANAAELALPDGSQGSLTPGH